MSPPAPNGLNSEAAKPLKPCSMPYRRTVNEKNQRTPTRMNAPAFGIHLPRRSEATATPMLIQMNASLNR